MKIVVMGTGSFGVPTLKALYETKHTIVALVTQQISGVAARKGKTAPPPEIVQVAEQHGTVIHRFANIKSPEAVQFLKRLHADLFFICDYGQILSQEAIKTALFGGLNLHGSLLPKYRGAAPVAWAIYNGDKTTGITVIHITPEVDAGPMIAKADLDIDPNETALELENRLAKLGVPYVLDAINRLDRGEDPDQFAIPQDSTRVSGAPKLRKHHARIDWTRSAREIHDQIRAFEPWPRTFTDWERKPGKPPIRLIPHLPTKVVDEELSSAEPGTILYVGQWLEVATGRGVLGISKLQPSGKKVLTIPEFHCGYTIHLGSRFI